MKFLIASMTLMLAVGAADAQLVPLGAPVIPPPKTSAAPPPASQLSSGRMRAAAPLGSNYSPYGLQPQGAVTANAPSARPADRTAVSGVANDLNASLPDDTRPVTKVKAPSQQQSDMQKLAPQGAERTQMQAADTPAPKR